MQETYVFGTLPLHLGTRAYLFLPDEGSCYIFLIRSSCCKFLASYDMIFQSDVKSYFKTPVCGAPLSQLLELLKKLNMNKLNTHFVELDNFFLNATLLFKKLKILMMQISKIYNCIFYEF